MGKSNFATSQRASWLATLLAALAGGSLTTYDGTQPADANTAPGASNHALATHTLPNPAGDIASTTLTLRAIAAVIIGRTGVANWVRFSDSLGNALFDGNVGNQTVTLTVAGAFGDTHLTVSALAQPLYAGQDLIFNDGGVLKLAHVNTNAIATATSVSVDALPAAISNGCQSTQCVTFDAPNLQQNAACPVTSVVITAPAQGS